VRVAERHTLRLAVAQDGRQHSGLAFVVVEAGGAGASFFFSSLFIIFMSV
jgi:hypothetical protein